MSETPDPSTMTTTENGGSGINSAADAAPLIAVAAAAFIFLAIAFGLLIYHCCRKRKNESDNYSTHPRRSYIDGYNAYMHHNRASTLPQPGRPVSRHAVRADPYAYDNASFTFPRDKPLAQPAGESRSFHNSMIDFSQLAEPTYSHTIPRVEKQAVNEKHSERVESTHTRDQVHRPDKHSSMSDLSVIDARASRDVLHKGRLSLRRGRMDLDEDRPQYTSSPTVRVSESRIPTTPTADHKTAKPINGFSYLQ